MARHGVVSLPTTFEGFVALNEARLRRALCATYGADTGREATVDALSYAWEHWDRIGGMKNPVGYLYRVGQSSARRQLRRPRLVVPPDHAESIDVEPGLERALGQLSEQQRAVVVLVHGEGRAGRRDGGRRRGRPHRRPATVRLARRRPRRRLDPSDPGDPRRWDVGLARRPAGPIVVIRDVT
jgi:hypothetical protein